MCGVAVNRFESFLVGFLCGQIISASAGANSEARILMGVVTVMIWVAVCLLGEK